MSEIINGLPAHKCGLYLEHNACRDYYQAVEEWMREDEMRECPYDWKSDEQKARAVASNEVWTLQWYPETPVGSHAIAAPTLAELLDFAKEYKAA